MTSSSRAVPAARGRRVVVGVTGSISAYKAPTIVRRLRQAGCEVRVVATSAALRFIGAPALAAVAGRPVHTGVFDDPAGVEHVELARWADLLLVAPASADTLARLAAGRADDLLTAVALATTAQVVLAPAMHTQMWRHPATQHNVELLAARGAEVIEPASGALTSGDEGQGRLPEPEEIVSRVLALLEPSDAVLSGRHVVVSAGGTHEPLDPVRFLGNRSSGRQGVALAAQAAAAGARVTLVAANVTPDVLGGLGRWTDAVSVVPVATALQLRAAVREAAEQADAVIMAAAVADYRPAEVSEVKIKKAPAHGAVHGPAQAMTLELVANPDILAELVSDPPRKDGSTLVVGFAAETGHASPSVLEHGAAKARRKGADLLAVNAVGDGLGFGDVDNAVVVLDADGQEVARAAGSKDEVAAALIDLVAQRLAPRVRTGSDRLGRELAGVVGQDVKEDA